MHHLKVLGCDRIKALHMDLSLIAEANKLDSLANTHLRNSTLEAFERHFNVGVSDIITSHV